MNTSGSTTEREQEQKRFDSEMFKAHRAYLGHQATILTKSSERPNPYPCDPQEASELGQTVWLQANPTKPGFPRKKAENEDIARLMNVTLDAEYPPDPDRLRVMFVEFRRRIIEKGYIEPEAEPPIEDSGAGNHMVPAITPLETTKLGGGEIVNEAVSAIVNTYFCPIFDECLREYGLADKGIKLEGFDISRILSAPGTWRPGGTKPGEIARLQHGYLRRWIYPHVDGNYPQRRESKRLAELIREKALEIKAQREAVVPEADLVIKQTQSQPQTFSPRPLANLTKTKGFLITANRPLNIEVWLQDTAARKECKNRSDWFQAVVSSCWMAFGDAKLVEDNAQLIDQLTGRKYGKLARKEALRSLGKAQQNPRLDLPDFYASLAYHNDEVAPQPQPQFNTVTDISVPNEDQRQEPLLEAVTDGQAQEAQEGAGAELDDARPTTRQHHLTDYGNARRLVERFGHKLRFVAERGWFIWDGQRWKQDKTGEVKRLAKRTTQSIYDEAGQVDDINLRKATLDHARKSESKGRISDMVSVAESEIEVVAQVEDFDNDPWLLNCENGIVDLRTGQLLHHDRTKLITKLAPVKFDSQAQCPTFLSFLNKSMGGDKELISFIQRAIGYTLTGSYAEEVIFFLYGTGRNGKTTLLETLLEAMGDYACASDSNTFLAERSGPDYDTARFVGVRMIKAEEPDAGKRLDESKIKQLTGGDTITAREIFKPPFNYKPIFKAFLAANHRPEIRGARPGHLAACSFSPVSGNNF